MNEAHLTPPASPPGQAAPRLVLASASPRRRELLSALGLTFDVIATDAEERPNPAPPPPLPPADVPPDDHPTLLAWRKARAAAAFAPGALILGADTTVVLDGRILNKPQDAAHAREMLRALAGHRHTVLTGLCLIDARGHEHLDLVAARVAFHPLSEAAIAAYVATGDPLDKAGSYGLQGQGGDFVAEVEGSYTAVVGLPLPAVATLLAGAGLRPPAAPEDAYRRWLKRQGKEPPPCPPTQP